MCSDEVNSRSPQDGKCLQIKSGKILEKEPFLLKQEGTFFDLLSVHPLFCPFRMPVVVYYLLQVAMS